MKRNHIKQVQRLAVKAAALAFTLLGSSSLQAGLHVWTGNGQFGPYFSDPDNWKSGFVPAANETNVTLEFPISSGNNQPIVDIANLKVDKFDFQGGYVLYGQPQGSKITIRGTTDAVFSSLSTTFHNSLELILEGATEIDVNFSRTVAILGKVSGVGGIVKTGLGTLDIGGSISNTYTGDTEIKTGTMRLMKATGIAVSGDVIVGDGIGISDSDLLKLSNNNQIVDTASITVKESGFFQLSSNDEVVGSLIMKGGHITTGTGTLLVGGSITSQAYTDSSLIEGILNLGIRSKVITVEDGGASDDLIINAAIIGNAGVGFNKSGAGTLVLGGASTFSGAVGINGGVVKATHAQAFGTIGAGTSVAAGAALWVNGPAILGEPLTLSGKGPGNQGTLATESGGGYWGGPITLLTDVVITSEAGLTLICAESIQGSGGIIKQGEGDLTFSGANPNTYTGTTTVLEGVLRLNKSANVISMPAALVVGHPSNSAFPRDKVIVMANNQIANSAAVTIHLTGVLEFAGASDGVGSLDFTGGQVVVNSATLTLLGPVHCSAPSAGPAFITGTTGQLSLGAQSRIFTMEANSTLRVTIPITGNNLIGLIKQGEGLLELTAANTYSGLTSIEDGSLLITGPDGTLGSAVSGTQVSKGAQLITSWVQVGTEALALNGDEPGTGRASFSAHGDCTWAGSISLNGGTNTIEVQTVRLIVSGAISGTGSLKALGHTVNNNPTKLWISGLDANTYTGGTTVDTCEVWLSKLPGKSAIPGALTLLDRAAPAEAASRVFLLNGEQLSDSSPVRLGRGSEMNLGNVNDTIGSLELYGAKAASTNGVLTLHGDVSVLGGATSTIGGFLNLGPLSRTLDVQGDSGGITELQLTAIVSSGAPNVGYRKIGKGDMNVSGKNTYSGLTRIQEGICKIFNTAALGDTVGETLVDAGGTLFLTSDVDVLGEKLTLNGAGGNLLYNGALIISGNSISEWSGPIVLNSDTAIVVQGAPDRFIHTGAISGAGALFKDGAGTFEIAGNLSNSYSGKTEVMAGIIELNKSAGATAIPAALKIGDGVGGVNADVVRLLKADQIANQAAVTMASSALFDLNSFSDTIGSLDGEGNVNLVLASLTTGGNNNNATFSGGIGGVGFTGLIKTGTGTMILTGESTYTGKTLVQGGKLLVNGHQSSSPVWVSNTALLGGSGTIGSLAATNGVISPGNSPGKLTTGNLAMNSSSIYAVEISGATAGTGYDQLAVTGTVALGGAELKVSLANGSVPGTEYVLISNDSNDAVQQTFAGHPEGAKFTVGGVLFQITYKGGDGNDVSLRHVNTPPSIVSFSATPTIKEGGNVTFDIVVNDPDASDSLKVVVNWGDGSEPDTYDLPPSIFGLTVQHKYADDNPTATPNDAYTINFAAHDTAGIGASASVVVSIENVAPAFKTLADSTATEQTLWTTEISFIDPGTDTWVASVDYGDGSGLQKMSVGPNKTLALSHTYADAGTYTVNVTVKDDDGGTGTAQFKVVVEALGQGPTLSIKPGPGDRVTLSWPASNVGYTLESTSDLTSGNWTPVLTDDSEINGEFVVIVPSLSPQQFFRLKK